MMKLREAQIMSGAPPDAGAQVTLANWREAPFSQWAFHHVRELIPTAAIDGAAARELESVPIHLGDVPIAVGAGVSRTFGDVIDQSWTTGLVVLHRGRVVHERYGQGYSGIAPHIVFSISKSITALVAGVLVGRNQLNPGAPVTHYIPEAAASAYGDCTVQHVLDMTVSCTFEEVYLEPDGDYAKYRAATGWNPALPGKHFVPASMRDFLLTLRRGPNPHGDVFTYLSPNTDLLGWVLERASGRRFADLMSDVLWRPLGAEAGASITVDGMGAPRTAGGVSVRPRDLARVGELMRSGGQIGETQIIPEDWVRDTLTHRNSEAWALGDFSTLLPKGAYRNAWYQTGLPSGAFCGVGIHGQWLYIDPTAEVVIARTAAQPEPVDEDLDRLHLTAFDTVARYLGSID